jgi:uncharacterized membrane-anchored protein
MQFTVIFMTGLLFCAGTGGFCLLKIYDYFKQAVVTKSRSRMWLALTASMFTLFVTIIGATEIGISLKQRKFHCKAALHAVFPKIDET